MSLVNMHEIFKAASRATVQQNGSCIVTQVNEFGRDSRVEDTSFCQ